MAFVTDVNDKEVINAWFIIHEPTLHSRHERGERSKAGEIGRKVRKKKGTNNQTKGTNEKLHENKE